MFKVLVLLLLALVGFGCSDRAKAPGRMTLTGPALAEVVLADDQRPVSTELEVLGIVVGDCTGIYTVIGNHVFQIRNDAEMINYFDLKLAGHGTQFSLNDENGQAYFSVNHLDDEQIKARLDIWSDHDIKLSGGVLRIAGDQIVCRQQPAIADATTLEETQAQLNLLLATCREHGLIEGGPELAAK